MPEISVRQLYEEQKAPLRLELVAGAAGLDNRIHNARLQKYSLAFAGYFEHFHPDRVQILGKTELSYLATLPAERARHVIQALCGHPICCILVTKGLDIPPELVAAAERSDIALLKSSCQSSEVISRLSAYLEDRLAPTTTLHGVLIDVDGVGVLMLGKSGIGKSESALHLIARGHRLVADDVVRIRRRDDALLGGAMTLARHHMEIRGLGILNIRDLFGVASIQEEKRIDLVIRLEEWEAGQEYDRLGLDAHRHEILGVSLPFVQIPVTPGRNIPTLVEVAARNQMLKIMGYCSAEAFNEEVLRHLAENAAHPPRPAGPSDE
ncbi:MAG: HPr(Ser) kinase/phosphatase [Candidatus Tectomicrobia bacterium]|nr:HPr(Ser) kinase/phosphatase [Candidatus Tectomicrobia bacterium]